MIQPTGFPEKIPLEMLSTDYIADLRAEVVKCWETIQINKANAQGTSSEEPGPISIEGPIRMITQVVNFFSLSNYFKNIHEIFPQYHMKKNGQLIYS